MKLWVSDKEVKLSNYRHSIDERDVMLRKQHNTTLTWIIVAAVTSAIAILEALVLGFKYFW